MLHWDSCCTVWYWFVRLVFVCNNQVVLYKLIPVAICVTDIYSWRWYHHQLSCSLIVSLLLLYVLKVFQSVSFVHNIINVSIKRFVFILRILHLSVPLLIIIIIRILYAFRSISSFGHTSTVFIRSIWTISVLNHSFRINHHMVVS